MACAVGAGDTLAVRTAHFCLEATLAMEESGERLEYFLYARTLMAFSLDSMICLVYRHFAKAQTPLKPYQWHSNQRFSSHLWGANAF